MHMTHVASINLATQNASPWAPMTSPSRGRSPRAWKCPMWCASSQTPGAGGIHGLRGPSKTSFHEKNWTIFRISVRILGGNVGDVSSKFEALSQPEWWYIYIYRYGDIYQSLTMRFLVGSWPGVSNTGKTVMSSQSWIPKIANVLKKTTLWLWLT